MAKTHAAYLRDQVAFLTKTVAALRALPPESVAYTLRHAAAQLEETRRLLAAQEV